MQVVSFGLVLRYLVFLHLNIMEMFLMLFVVAVLKRETNLSA